MQFMQSLLVNKAISIALILVVIIMVRVLIVSRLQKHEVLTPIQGKKYIVSVQNAAFFLLSTKPAPPITR